MKSWPIRYDQAAREDIFAIIDRIAQDSAINAEQAFDRLDARIRTLDRFPERGRVVPELQWHGLDEIREIFENPWRILYEIDDHEVWIVAVFDGRRSLEQVLIERFMH